MLGVLESGVSYHHPVICFINDTVPEVNLDQRSRPKFYYCEPYLNSFSETTKWLEHENIPEYSECYFNKCTDYIKQEINEHFLVDENASKKSKRTILFNPWTTPGIIVFC